MKRQSIILPVLLIAAALAACGNDPSHTAAQGSELFTVSFDESGSWEEGSYPSGADDPGSTLVISDGRYRIDHRPTGSNSFTWGTGGDAYEDVIIDVETEQLSRENNNLYGIGCRLETNADGSASGYALLISGDGHYGIARLNKTSLSFVLDWHQSGAIHENRAKNTIRAVCVDDYLAVYANGEFLGEVTDDTYRRAGQVALIAGVIEEGDVSVAFDNLAVYEGTLGGE
ncbi:MAG: hypothetical protein JXJ20_02800 [Anaerolineae bacterium]|nr:hypothetical protein [Anaerolineae bacterium]